MNFNKGFINIEIIIAIVITSIIAGSLTFKIYEIITNNYLSFEYTDKLSTESRLVILKFEYDIDKAVTITNASDQSLSFIDTNNRLINYNFFNSSLLKNINSGTSFPATNNLTDNTSSNNFQYYDTNMNQLISTPLNAADLDNIRFIKFNIEMGANITQAYNSTNLLYKYDN